MVRTRKCCQWHPYGRHHALLPTSPKEVAAALPTSPGIVIIQPHPVAVHQPLSLLIRLEALGPGSRAWRAGTSCRHTLGLTNIHPGLFGCCLIAALTRLLQHHTKTHMDTGRVQYVGSSGGIRSISCLQQSLNAIWKRGKSAVLRRVMSHIPPACAGAVHNSTSRWRRPLL